MATTKIIIADDHPLFRTALKTNLEQSFSGATIREAEDIASLQALIEDDGDIDLILLDLNMPGAHGFSGLIQLQAHHPEIPVMIISAAETTEIMCRAIDHGAAGFLPKSSDTSNIASATAAILAGDRWLPAGVSYKAAPDEGEQQVAKAIGSLTPQQFRVATLLVQGLLNKQIAYELSVTEATIKAHITEIFRKLGVHSRTQAVLAINQLDVLQADLPN